MLVVFDEIHQHGIVIYLGYTVQRTVFDTVKVQHVMELHQFFFARLQSLGSSLPVHTKKYLRFKDLLSSVLSTSYCMCTPTIPNHTEQFHAILKHLSSMGHTQTLQYSHIIISRYIIVHEKLTIMTLVGTEAYDT